MEGRAGACLRNYGKRSCKASIKNYELKMQDFLVSGFGLGSSEIRMSPLGGMRSAPHFWYGIAQRKSPAYQASC